MATRNRRTEPVRAQAKGGDDALLAGGDERSQGARWEQSEETKGSVMLGKLIGTRPIKFKDGKEGTALVFSPALVRDPSGEIVAHRVCETIYSAVLAQRITPETDKHVVFGIRFDGYEPSATKGRADFKTYTVVEQKPAVLIKQLEECGAAELAQLVRSAE